MKRLLLISAICLMASFVCAKESASGFVVQIGCDDPKSLAELADSGRCVVQGLDTDPEKVARARDYLQKKGLYGKVSVQVYDGQSLPYVDNLVNQIVVTGNKLQVAGEEIERVLAPRGVILSNRKLQIANCKSDRQGDLFAYRKEVPESIDDWSHYLHDPSGSSVSDDLLAGHPRGLKWEGGPFWARSHEHTAGMNAMVSEKGRVFYVMDEGRVDSIQLPSDNYLTARDAFSGVVLWRRSLKDWWNALYPLKSGPGWLPRRLVAVDDRVYLAPGAGHKLVCLDAATGETVHTYKETENTFELIVSDGVIFASIDTDCAACDYNQQHANCWKERDRASKKYAWQADKGTHILKAIDDESGKLLWESATPVTPMSLTANSEIVCFHDGSNLVALDRKTGEQKWKTAVHSMSMVQTGYSGPRLILHGDKVLFAPLKAMYALNAKTGEKLWEVKNKPVSGHHSLEDFYIIKDKVWVLERPNNGKFTVYNLETGKVDKKLSNPISSFYIHQRCYPGRATQKYQLPPMMGIQVYDMDNDTWENNHWVRGGCIYGVMPANGMVYATPHACACYYQSKLNGFNALAPVAEPSKVTAPEKRLISGPAYRSIKGKPAHWKPSPAEWPVFRQNNERTSYVKTEVSSKVKESWKKKFNGKVSQPTVANGILYVSEVDAHTVHAVDADKGKTIWSFTADARIDSPPTIHKGVAYFGSDDGNVYAVTAKSGELEWKFRAAPTERKMISYNQPESVWPVSGSVLIENNKLYCVAGRSMFLDGGLRMLTLHPDTGELISENVMDRKAPGTDKDIDSIVQGKHMPVALPDILSSDGKNVFMKSQVFDMEGKRTRIEPRRPDDQYGEGVHLFSPISFLDNSWHQRTYWIYGKAAGEGWAEFQYPPKRVPCGRVMCIDEKNAYSYGRDPELMVNTSVSEYRLFSAAKVPTREEEVHNLEGKWAPGKAAKKGQKKQAKAGPKLARNSVDWHQMRSMKPEELSALDYNWINEEPDVMAKAMVLANDNLYIAGPRDVADEKTLWGKSNEEGFKAAMHDQNEWMNNRKGGILQVFSKNDGKKLSEMKIDSLPAFDGLVAADGSLFMATADGSIVCYK